MQIYDPQMKLTPCNSMFLVNKFLFANIQLSCPNNKKKLSISTELGPYLIYYKPDSVSIKSSIIYLALRLLSKVYLPTLPPASKAVWINTIIDQRIYMAFQYIRFIPT